MIRQTLARLFLGALTCTVSWGPVRAVRADDAPVLAQPEVALTPEELKAAASRSTMFDGATAVLTASRSVSVPGLSASPPLSLGDRVAMAAQQLVLDANHAGSQLLRSSSASPAAESAPATDERVIGTDNRTQVTNTTATPFKAICFISTAWPNNTSTRGTAEFVGTRVLLSAAHCVYDSSRGGWAKSVRVVPGKNGSSEPFGSQYAYTAYIPSNYANGDKSASYDISWVILPDKTLFNRIGYAFGYAAPSDSSLQSTKLNLAGYPADKSNYTMWQEYGGGNQVVYPSMFYHYFDTEGGSSGSPMWYYNGSSRYVWGVHCQSSTSYNAATRMTSTYYSWTNQFKSQYP